MIEVAAGVLIDDSGRVLLIRRLPGKHLAGLWEFPGGKIEADETVADALARELEEELGIVVRASVPVISIPWDYAERSVRLHALRVTAWQGTPQAREGHPLRWVDLRDVEASEMPAADVPILAALRLPRYCVISETLQTNRFRSGEALWQLRRPDAPRDEVRRIALHALAVEPALRGSLLLNHDVELARELGVGVQLKAAQLREWQARPLPRTCWVGASCHDAEELALAAELGADFATLSPVRATASHPDTAPLGWERFAQWVSAARLPVYALGGVGPDDLARARAAGAQGVAGIRAFLA